MKIAGTIYFTLFFLLLGSGPLRGQNLPHPYDSPAVNFQGRIEVGDIGYSGASWFRFSIGSEDMSQLYWSSWAATTCVEGIYNVILGKDTADALPSSVFTPNREYFLQVAFSTNGSHFETLLPTQEILTVPFAVNADLLDGLQSPESAFVGLTDVQTITNKTLTDATLTRPVIDSSYFFVTPGNLPLDPAKGYFAFDNTDNTFKYFDGNDWVSWGESSVTSPWIQVGTTIIPRNEGDFVQLTGASRLLFSRSVYGSASSPLISFNPEDGGTGIYKAGPDQIDFSTQSSRRFTVRSTGAIRFIPIPQPATGLDGDFYYDTDQDSLMYYKGATWHPVASGAGSIEKPGGADRTLRGLDANTWTATTGFLISADGTATVQKDIRIRQKMYFYGDTNTYLQGPDQDTLEFYTGSSLALTLTPSQRLQLFRSGTMALPAVSFGNQSQLGIYADPTNNHISFASNQTDMFSLRGQGHVRFRPLGEAPAVGVSRSGDLYFNAQTGTFMYYHGGWKPIASGEGSIPKPDAQYDTLYASDNSTWAPTNHLRVYPHDKVTTRKDLQVGWSTASEPKIYFGTASTTYITSPSAGIIDLYTGGTRRATLSAAGRWQMTASGTVGEPVISFGDDIDTGIWSPGANNIGIGTGGIEALRVRANQQVGLGTGAVTSARLHVNETANQQAFRIDQAADQYAAFINQSGLKSALWIDQRDTTGAGAPAAGAGGAVHIYNRAAATGSAITAYSNVAGTVAPLAWLKVAAGYTGFPVLRLEGRSSHASPLHLVAQASPSAAPEAGEIYMDTDGYLYFHNGANWIALTGSVSASEGGPVFGSGADKQAAYWVSETALSSEAAFAYDYDTDTLTVSKIGAFTLAGAVDGGSQAITNVNIDSGTIDGAAINTSAIGLTTAAAGTFTNLTATTAALTSGAVIDEFSTDGALSGNSDAAVPTEQAVKTYVDGLANARVGGAGTAEQVAFWTSATEISGDVDLTFDGAVLTATAADFTTLTAGTVATNLTAGRIVYTGVDGLLSEEAALAYAVGGEVTLASGATGGKALQVTADALTTGTALDVSSTAADTGYDLVKFSAQTGRALVVSHAGGGGGAGNEAVLIERTSPGRALGVHAANTTGDGVYIRSSTASSGNVLNVTSLSDDLSTGAAVQIYQSRPAAGGTALFVRQAGRGKAAQFTNQTGSPALMINQAGNSDSGITATDGGALHIENSGNAYGGLTVYTNSDGNQVNPLVTFRVNNTGFGRPVLHLDPSATGDAPHLYLTPVAAATFNPAATSAGMLYASSTTKALMYYNGADWIALTGTAGGAGDFATRALDNLASVAINTPLLPEADNTIDLGSAARSWKDLYVDGTGNIATAAIAGGAANNMTVGLTTPAAAKFSTLTAGIVALDATGSATNPVITWAADPDTGLYRIGPNQLGVATAGDLQATFDATGHFILSGNGSYTNPILSLGGETNTGIYQADAGNIDFTNLGTRLFSMRSSGVFRLIGAAGDPAAAASNAGGIFYNTTDKSFKYSDGARWITLTGASQFTGSGTAGQTAFWSSATQLAGNNNFFWDDATSWLGIRTTAPALSLDVRGANAKSTTASEDIFRIASTGAGPLQLRLGLRTNATAASRYAYLDVEDNGTIRPLVLQKDGGNIGIGTTSPREILDISGGNNLPLHLENLSTTAGDVTGVYFRVHSSGVANRKGALIFERTASYGRGSIHLATEDSGNGTNVSKANARLTVTSDGLVGIGTTAPAESLSVAGRAWLQQTAPPATTTDRLYNVSGALLWDGEPLARWNFRDFTRSADDTFTVTDNAVNQAAFKVGTPLRYGDTVGTWRYGMVVDYTTGTVTLAGAAMTADFDAYLQTGNPEMLRQANFYKPEDIAVGDNFMGLATWQMAEGYVVRATGQLETAADGADALVAIGIGAAGTDLITGAGQLNLAQATNQAATAVNIDPANYNITFGEKIFVNVDQVGSGTPGAGLLLTLQVVTP